MERLNWQCPVLVLFLLFLHFQVTFSFSSASSLQTSPKPHHPGQCIALVQFKNTFAIESFASVDCDTSHPKTESWKEGVDCCSWDGVTCDGLTGYVIGLNLSCSWLSGTIHSNSTLFLLPHLQKLNLAFNDFNRCLISSKFGHFTSLTHLNLSSSGFSGPIPSEITHLSKLVLFDLSKNDQLTFHRHDFKKLLENLTELNYLALVSVNMSEITSDSLSNLPSSLKLLRLKDCQLRGYLTKSNWSSPLRVLDLTGNGFTGTIPTSVGNLTQLSYLYLSDNYFSGQIPSSLSNLESLTELRLPGNIMSGPIPNFLGNFKRLTYLDLSANNFSGQIPSSVFNLSQLSFLDFSLNRIVGQIPNQVSEVSILDDLRLSDNLLSGTMPSWLFTLPSLERLDLSNNQLTGQIPEFLSKSLSYVYLSNNKIQGTLPNSIFELVSVTDIDLSSNNLSGILDLDMFSKLKTLFFLSLSESGLSLIADSHGNSTWPKLWILELSSCNVTNFPVFLRTQDELQFLNLSYNNIHGEIPQWVSVIAENPLSSLDLSHNFLTTLKPRFLRYPDYLDLHSNFIQGPLPIPILEFTSSFVSLSNNKFTGEIPSSICNFPIVQIIDLSNNNLSGRIPACLGNSSFRLSVLNLRMNSFQGSIPRNFAEGSILRNLDLNGNQLEGQLPRSLVNCKQLEVLDVGHNEIAGGFPHWLESLPNLQVLVLRSNRFHGPIADPKSRYSFPKLRIIDLSLNAFTGFLSTQYFESLKAMMNLDEEKTERTYMGQEASLGIYYHDSVVVTMKGLEIELDRILTIFTTIDLSKNKFKGKIPEIVGNLDSLRLLNLSHNSLSGQIPSSLGNITALESLDLSSNKLVGEIPHQLTSLTFLAVLNLSQNLLEGPIPRGKQFDTFDNKSYVGNLGLCGLPLSKKCGNDEVPQLPSPVFYEEDDSTSGFDWKIAAMGYGCGLVLGLSTGYIVFATKRPWWFVKMVEGDWHEKVVRVSQGLRRRRRNL